MMNSSSALAFALAATSPPPVADTLSIEVGKTRLVAPIPAGYCIPMAEDQKMAEAAAAIDKANILLATLIRCDKRNRPEGPGPDSYEVKVPREAIGVIMEREDFLVGLRSAFPDQNLTDDFNLEEVHKRMSNGLSESSEADISLSGRVSGRGIDKNCFYLGGTISATIDGNTVDWLAGACLTSTNGAIFSVYARDEADAIGGVAGQMLRARDFALSFVPNP
jgi:hypothetical protein